MSSRAFQPHSLSQTQILAGAIEHRSRCLLLTISVGIAAFFLSSLNANAQVFSTVVIDPGHGGKEAGATHGGMVEKHLNLHWAMAVERHLHDMGVNTAITRDKDITLSLSDRAAYAKYFQRPLFVSLHYNGATNQQAKGIETFFYNQASRRLASLVQDALIRATGAKDRGVKNRGFKVICENVAPVAVLVEGGFLSNVSERTRISQIAYREMQAHAVATAIAAFMGRHPMALPPQPRRTVLVRQPIPQSPRTAVPVWVSAAPANTISSSFQRLTRFWR